MKSIGAGVLGCGGIVIAFVVIMALGIGGAFGSSWFKTETAGWFGRNNQEQTVQAAPYRIAAYDHFFNACASIQSTEGAINQQYAALDAATNDDQRNRSQIAINANQTLRIQAINQYNVDARKEGTEGQFRDSSLPFQIPNTVYQRDAPVTYCGAA